MTTDERINLFRQAIVAIEKLERVYPSHPPFESIHNQLVFLLDQVSAKAKDRERLAQINLGVLTVREVEPLDNAAADLFHLVSAEARKMLTER